MNINEIELACVLAEEVIKTMFNGDEDEIFMPNPDGEGTIYTKKAQIEFNIYYDKYLTIIEQCKN